MIQNYSEQTWDVVIIGAGAAGLTASIYLARAGKTVLLLDRGAHTGGRAISTEIASSRVNLGAHALNHSALTVLQEVNVKPTGSAPKPPGLFMFKEANGKIRSVSLMQLLLGSFLMFHEKTQLLRLFSRLRKTDTSALHNVTLRAHLESLGISPRVHSIVKALVRLSTYCDASDLLSAGAVIEQMSQGQVLYIDGGWQTIVNGLTEQAQKEGVSIRTSSPAREIVGSYPKLTVTLKDGTHLVTRHVLSTVGPTDMLDLLNPALTSTEAKVYQRLIPVHAACLDIVVTGKPRPERKFVLGADYPWYYSNHSVAASLSDNPAYAVIHVMKYLEASKRSDPKQDEHELKGFLDTIQPGWRKYVIQERFLPHMLVSHGIVTAANGGLPCRPGPAVKGRPGLYVAGDWVGSTGMLLNASLASAKEAAGLIIASSEQQ